MIWVRPTNWAPSSRYRAATPAKPMVSARTQWTALRRPMAAAVPATVRNARRRKVTVISNLFSGTLQPAVDLHGTRFPALERDPSFGEVIGADHEVSLVAHAEADDVAWHLNER